MISQKIKASARILGAGLLAVAVSAPLALAQAKKTQCPFSSKDIDGWYKAIGFDTGADEAGGANVTCAIDDTFVTLSEIELRQGPKDFNGETVLALSTNKQILVNVSLTDGPEATPQYTIELTRDGSPILDPKAGNDFSLDFAEYEQCVSAVLSSQAWKRWACGKQ